MHRGIKSAFAGNVPGEREKEDNGETMSKRNDLSNRINEKFKSMSKGQKLLASYIMDHYDKAVFLTAAKLGEVVGVSESTVVRFATNLGYKGYPEFQSELEIMVRDRRFRRTEVRLWMLCLTASASHRYWLRC